MNMTLLQILSKAQYIYMEKRSLQKNIFDAISMP